MTVRTRSKSLFRCIVPIVALFPMFVKTHSSLPTIPYFKISDRYNDSGYQGLEMHDRLEYYSECSVHAFSWNDVFVNLYYQPCNSLFGSWRAVDSGRTTFFVLIVVLQPSWSFELCSHHSVLSRALFLHADSDVRLFSHTHTLGPNTTFLRL